MNSSTSPKAGTPQQYAETRARLLDGALRVAADHGIDDRAIPLVIAMAHSSPIEFSEHFAEPEELWQVLADALSNELVALIEATAGEFVDAAKRIGCGVRLYVREARENPVFARVVAHHGLAVAKAGGLAHHYLTTHVCWGNSTARFSDTSLETATDLIAGTIVAAVQRIADGIAPADHAEDVALAILKSLGVPALQGRRLIKVELPRLQASSAGLLSRARLMNA